MPASFKYKIQQVSSFDLPSHGLTLVFFKVDFENSIVQKTWHGSEFRFAISKMVLKVLQKSDKGQFFTDQVRLALGSVGCLFVRDHA